MTMSNAEIDGNCPSGRNTLFGKVPNLDTDDGNQVCKQCIKFGAHG